MGIVSVTRRMVSRSAALVLVTAVFTITSALPAAASDEISVVPASAAPGDTVTIAGIVGTSGCPADDAAQLTSTDVLFPPDGFGPAAPREASGKFSIQYAIPASTPPDTYSIGVRCGGGNVGISAQLEVVAAAPATTSTTTTTTAPKTSTTTSITSTTTSTTLASTLSSTSASSNKSSSSPLPWILLVLAAIVAAVSVTYFVRSRRQT